MCILADADSDGAHIATLLCALSCDNFPELVASWTYLYSNAATVSNSMLEKKLLRYDGVDKQGVLDRLQTQKSRTQPVVQRFKGLGEMNALQYAKPR